MDKIIKNLVRASAAVAIGAGLFAVGGLIGQNAAQPRQVYAQTKDNTEYLIVSDSDHNRYIFVAQPDGSYKPLSQIQEEQRSKLEEMAKQLSK